MKKKPCILAHFTLQMTSKQVRQVYKHFTEEMRDGSNYIVAFQPKPCIKRIKVAIIRAEFGYKLKKLIAAEKKRCEL